MPYMGKHMAHSNTSKYNLNASCSAQWHARVSSLDPVLRRYIKAVTLIAAYLDTCQTIPKRSIGTSRTCHNVELYAEPVEAL
jgi:hypothetical protein